ncbi:SAF domain-containing protein [Octadecabacter sp.]|nr:SAF domain-containing protein [Octadecabacter sp.]
MWCLCTCACTAWDAVGKVDYGRKSSEVSNVTFRRSLYFIKDLTAADIIKADDFRSMRPGFGAAPKFADQVIGMRVRVDVEAGTPVLMDQLLS